MRIELLDPSNLPDGVLPDYSGTGKVIKFTNYFDKSNPDDNLEDGTQHFLSPTEVYVHPQILLKNGMWDINLQGAINSNIFTEKQLYKRCCVAINLLDYIESRLKKEKHRIKRLMPTPEQIEQADKTSKEYISRPIVIKDVSVRYIYEPHETKKYKRHCEAWGVRGHYRRYKNGKTVYIHPYTKGSGRIKDTIYKLTGKED